MTDSVHSLVVVLEKPIREDDAERLIDAIKQFRGVAAVSGSVANIDHYSARQSAQSEIRKKLWDVLYADS